MGLQLVGFNHHTCPLALREQLAITGPAVPSFMEQFRRRFPDTELVLLSTCNRLELYTSAGDCRPTPEDSIGFLLDQKDVTRQALASAFYRHRDDQAIRHLFMVASSLDSMIVGDSQILRQVRRAYEIARRHGCAGSTMHGAFQAAIRTARRIARETDLFRTRDSIPRLAIRQCARPVLGTLRDKRIVVLGAGEMAAETLRALTGTFADRDDVPDQIAILNHRLQKARKLSEQFGARAWDWQDLPAAFAWADLVVTATSSRTVLVSLDSFQDWIAARRQRALLILDFGVPRDLDPRVGAVPGVSLFSIDDLREIAEQNRRRRESEIPQAMEIVDEESNDFTRRIRARDAGKLIRQLQSLREEVLHEELCRLGRLFPNLDDETRDAVRLALHRFAGRLMHPLVTSMREGNRPCLPKRSTAKLLDFDGSAP